MIWYVLFHSELFKVFKILQNLIRLECRIVGESNFGDRYIYIYANILPDKKYHLNINVTSIQNRQHLRGLLGGFQ